MIRRLLVTFALLIIALVSAAGWAGAATTTPYPAPPVTATISVLPTSSSAVLTPATTASTTPVPTTDSGQAAPTNPLAYTGSGVDVGLTLGIGALVVLLGIMLVVLGGRRAIGKPRQHS